MPSEGTGPRRAAVLGSPVAHSLSPVLHRAAYDALGLDWRYDAVECDEPGLAAFLDGLDDSWVGLSLTMPLKRTVVPLLDESSDVVRLTGVANTVLLKDGRRCGDNTDVDGFVSVLEATAPTTGGAGLIGGGATAVSALVALHRRGVTEVDVLVRSPARAQELSRVASATGMTVRLHTWSDPRPVLARELVISTVPAGATDTLAPEIRRLSPEVFVDVVYAPWPTAAAAAAQRGGATVVGGLALLVAQAARQVEQMTGRPVPLAVLRAAGEAAQRAR